MDKKSAVIVVGIAAMVIAVLAGLHWNRQTVPVNDTVPGTIAMISVGFVSAIIFGAVARIRVTIISLIVCSSLAVGGLLDTIIHFFVPPEAANLFPLVIAALGGMGALVGLVGGLVGKGIALLLGSVGTSDGT